jgi:hypothetical protein
MNDALSVLATVLGVPAGLVALALLFGRGSRGGVYVWRTRKPGALLGWPIIGRHFAYVGETSSFKHRERQHLGRPIPNDPYASTGAAWCDLAPRCYRIPLRGKWLRKIAEPLLVWTLFPVYNVQFNKHNPRRISRYRAIQMRATRDSRARRPHAIALAARLVGALRWYHFVGSVVLASVGIGWLG